MRILKRAAIFGCVIVLFSTACLSAEESLATSWIETLKREADEAMFPKTLGGRQFWGDISHLRGWRIQQNVFTQHCRLLDPDDVRHTWGTLEECQAALKKVSEEQKFAPMSGPAVILIHGLLRSSKCMAEMEAKLNQAGYTTVEFDYPSTQISIPDAARNLDRLIQSLDGIDEINFVVHSMGGLVVRAYTMEFDDPRIRRMVMLGTPNRGAELADITHQSWILRTAAGPGARQLGTRRDGLIPKLPVPKFEFAVIAGSRGTPNGWNPLIPGDDDGTVTVESTKLPGAADFNMVRALHSNLLFDDDAVAQTVNFLKNGRLRSDAAPEPILAQEPESAVKN